jgi:hypothetical protein
MAQTVKLRRSALPGRVPNNAQLELGELSMNTTDGKIFLAKSGSNGPSVEEVIITNTQNTGSIELVGSISSSFFTGSFIGDGSRLTNIQASGVTGLSLDRIANTTATASISPSGFSVNVNTSITGSLTATSITGSGLGLTDVPFHITGSDGTSTSDKQFTKLLFDDSTGIKLTETVDGVARVYLEGVAAEGSGDGRTSKLEVTESSSIWVLTHGLNERYPAITVFDSNGDVIIPQRIETISVNQLKVYFNNPQTGVVTATLGGGLPIISASYNGRVLSVNDGVATWKDGIVSSSLQFDSTTDPFTGSFYGTFRGDIQGTANITGDFIPVLTDTYNLGSVDNQWKDLFLSSGSLYIDGTKVISSNTAELIISTDLGQSLKFLETGADDITLQTENGNIELKGTVEILSGKKILDSAGAIIQFGDSLGVTGSIEVSGTVDGIDLQQFSSSVSNLNINNDRRLGLLETASGSIINDFNTYTSSNNTTNTTQNNRIGSLEVESGSIRSEFNDFTSSLDTALEFTGSDVTIKGNLLVKGTESRINSTTIDVNDNIISLNGSGAVFGGLEVRDVTAPGVVSGSLLWDSNGNYWIGGQKGTEVRFLNTDDLTTLNVTLGTLQTESGSIRGDFNSYTQSNNSTNSDQNRRLDGLDIFSGSAKLRLNSIETLTSSLASISSVTDVRDDFNTYTSSNDATNNTQNGKLGLLETASGSIRRDFNDYTSSNNSLNNTQNGRLSSLENASGSVRNELNNYTSSNNTTNTNQNNRLSTLETKTGSLDTLNTTQNGRLTSLEVETGSINSNILTLDGRIEDVEITLGQLDSIYATDLDINTLTSALNTYTSSNNTTNTTQNGRLTSLETKTGSLESTNTTQNTRLSSLETKTGSLDGVNTTQNGRLTSLETINTTQNGRLDSLEIKSGSLETTNTTQNGRLGSLETESGSIRTAFNSYTSSNNTTNTTQNGRLGSLESVTGSFLTEHPAVDAEISSNNSGRTYIQDILLDNYGHITGITTSTETVVNTDLYTTGATFNNSNGILTFTKNNSDTYTVNLASTLTDVTVTGGTYDSGSQTLRLTKSDGNSVSVSGFAIDTDVNWYSTGATFNSTNGIITFTRNDGGTFTVDIDGKYAESAHTHTFASLTSKPTTLVGYGITDAATSSQGTKADTAFGWGDHSTGGYLRSHPIVSAATSSDNSGRTYIQDILLDGFGHITGLTTATETVVNTDTNNYPNSVSWNSDTGVISIGRQGLTTLTVDIDGRFIPLNGDAVISGVKTFETALTNEEDWINSPISILERDGIGSGSTENIYSPNLNFHWRNRVSRSIWMDSTGNFHMGEYSSTGVPTNTGTLYLGDGNSSQWNTAYGWGNHASAGYLTVHPSVSAAGSSNNSGRTYIQDILLDSFGHITGITTSTETVINTDTIDYVSNVTLNDTTLRFEGVGNGFTGDVDLSIFTTDVTVTGGTYNSGNQILTLNKNNGTSVNISGFAIDTDVNWYTTGATFNTGNGVITGTRNDGQTWTVDIDGRYSELGHTHPYLPLSGGTVSGSTWNNSTGGNLIIENSSSVGSSITLRPTNSVSYSKGFSLYAGSSAAAIGDGSIGFWNHTTSNAVLYVTQSGNLTVTGTLTASGYNKTNWDTSYGWGNHAGLYSLVSHTHTFASLTSKPTTISGYGITDAITTSNIGSQNVSSANILNSLGNYVWNASSLPSTFSGGITTSFVSDGQGFPSFGSLMMMKTYDGGGGSLQLYTPYSELYGGSRIGVRFGNYASSNGNSWTGWKYLLNSVSDPYAYNMNQNVRTTDAVTFTTITATGGNSGNWNTAFGWGNHASAGYLTSYTETDTLASVTGRGASTSTPITVTGTEGREVAVFIPSTYTTGDLVSGHEYGWYNDHWRLGMTRSSASAGDDFVIQWNGVRKLSLTNGGNLNVTGTITATGGNSGNWNTAFGWGNHSTRGYLTAHPSVSAAGSSNNSGRTYIQDILLDSFGHITGLTTATETVVNTDTIDYVSNVELVDTTLRFTGIGNAFAGDVDLSIFATDVTVTGGTYNSATQTLRLTKNNGVTVDISGFAIDTDVNWYVTGATFNTGNGIISLTRNDGTTVTVDIDGKYAESAHTHTFASLTSKPTTLAGYGITDASSSGHNHDGTYVRSYTTSAGDIDADWGQSFKTFDPVPSGTPPLASPNIRTINIGENFARRTQLAFDYASDLAYFRRRNDSGWQTWREFIHSGNISTQSVSYADSAGTSSSATTSSQLTVNSGNTSAGWYPITWHSGNTVYSSSGVEIYAAGNYIRSSYINTTDNDETNITRFVIKNGDNYHRSATATTAANVIRGVASGSWGINITGSAASATTATNLGADYTADDWFRATADNNPVKFYGNTYQMTFRTDGASEAYSGIGGYPFVWSYGGSTSDTRIMLLSDTGRLWTKQFGWLDEAFASSAQGTNADTAYGWGNHASGGYATLAGSNSFGNSYNEFGNGTGSVSNDGSWNGRVNIAGTQHARLDVVSVSDGIVTSMYSHTGNGAGKMGTMSNHPLKLMVNGGDKATLDGSGNFTLTGSLTASGYNPTSWDTAYGWGNHASGGYIVKGSTVAETSSWADATKFRSNGDISQTTAGNHSLQVYADINNDAFMAFHISSDYAVYFGLENATNRLYTGGWSTGADKHQIWDSRDFSSTNISNWNTSYGWGNHAGLYLSASGKAADSELLDGVDSGYYVKSGAGASVSGWLIDAFRNGSGTSPRIYMSSSTGYGMHINTYNTSASVYGLEIHNNAITTFMVYNDGDVIVGKDLEVTGDLKMQGTDSYIWTPNTVGGFTGFWDQYNSRIASRFSNNVGWGFLGDPESGYAIKSHGSIRTTGSVVASGSVNSGSNFYADANYGYGLVGLYSSTRYQGVFAMGDSYKLSADGTSTGSLYGIAWTHSNVGGQSISGLSHQMLIMENGGTSTAIGRGIYTVGDITSNNDIFANGQYYYGDGKKIIDFADSWLRLNPSNGFSSGIYCDTGILRTDGNLQVGSGGTYFNANSSEITAGVNLIPKSNGNYNLGSPTNGWANIYTNDLHLSNEGKDGGNDVDGTTGSWTIQEGEENLYLINNKNGKKFRINLEEL